LPHHGWIPPQRVVEPGERGGPRGSSELPHGAQGRRRPPLPEAAPSRSPDLAVTLDSGAKMSSARIRPHLTVTMEYETFTALADATKPVFTPRRSFQSGPQAQTAP